MGATPVQGATAELSVTTARDLDASIAGVLAEVTESVIALISILTVFFSVCKLRV